MGFRTAAKRSGSVGWGKASGGPSESSTSSAEAEPRTTASWTIYIYTLEATEEEESRDDTSCNLQPSTPPNPWGVRGKWG